MALALLAAPAAAQDGRVYELAEAETLPRALNPQELTAALHLNYPRTARDSAFDGTVLVSMVVSATGVPDDIAVVAPADPGFDSATVASVQVLRFLPGTVDGRAVPVRVTLPVTWQFRAEAPPAPESDEEAAWFASLDSAAAEMARGALDLEMVEEPPRVLNPDDFMRTLSRVYPRLLRDAGVRGEVTVRFVVRADGRPDHIHVVRASMHQFITPTIRAVEALRFRPARVNGRPVSVRVVQQVQWMTSGNPTSSFLSPPVRSGGGSVP